MKMLTTAVLLLTSAIGLSAQGLYNISVVPNGGSQSYSKTIPFTASWSSNGGAGNIRYAMLYVGGCYVYYTPSTAALFDPDTNLWVTAQRTVGLSVLRNRICAVTVDKAHLDNEVLSVEFLINFPLTAGGNSYPIYLAAQDFQGNSTPFEQKGVIGVTAP